MKKSEFNQGVTVKVVIYDHVRSDGNNTIYLRITIDRKKRDINLKTNWPKLFFDTKTQTALPRFAKDKEVDSVNMVIEEARGRANRIKLRYFTDGKILTLEQFAQEFETYESRDNFLFYWLQKQNEIANSGKITPQTSIRHNTNRERLIEFNGGSQHLAMSDITPEFVQKYRHWMLKVKKPKLKHNTAIGAIKVFQAYVNHAINDGFRIKPAFQNLGLRFQQGTREPLDKEELQLLKDELLNDALSDTEREVLRKFLFSCYTGLRISDSALITSGMIRGGKLTFKPKKGERYGKELEIPLPHYALKLIEGRRGNLFKPVADQTCNDCLKIIGGRRGIEKKLTFHVSRDTFATLFLEMGGDVYTLKELMGHSTINTTMIYVKMNEKRKETLMDNFNNL